jgi:hypothetical protein
MHALIGRRSVACLNSQGRIRRIPARARSERWFTISGRCRGGTVAPYSFVWPTINLVNNLYSSDCCVNNAEQDRNASKNYCKAVRHARAEGYLVTRYAFLTTASAAHLSTLRHSGACGGISVSRFIHKQEYGGFIRSSCDKRHHWRSSRVLVKRRRFGVREKARHLFLTQTFSFICHSSLLACI